jgi:hypothetical protein
MTASRPARTAGNNNPVGTTEMGTQMKQVGIRGLVLVHTIASLVCKCMSASTAGTAGREIRANDHQERGDVPGWVMITWMSAVLVAALLALAGPALEGLFNQAMDKVGK